jgi:hypothetical protein
MAPIQTSLAVRPYVLISSPEEDAGEMELRVEGLEPGRDLAVAGDESDQRLGHDSENAQRKMRKARFSRCFLQCWHAQNSAPESMIQPARAIGTTDVAPASYIIDNNSGIITAYHCITGTTDISGSDAASVINSAISAVGTRSGKSSGLGIGPLRAVPAGRLC